MKHFLVLFFITFISGFSLLFSMQTASDNDENGAIQVEIYNFRNKKGNLFLYLYNSKQTFLDAENAYRTIKLEDFYNNVTVTFDNLPDGEYAVGLLHDENNNKKFDFLKEGFAVSLNKRQIGPPTFGRSKFSVNKNTISIKIKVKYSLFD